MTNKAKIRTSVTPSSYLIKSHNVYSTAEIDVLGVQTVDAFLLESFLSKSIVGGQGWWQHGVDNECKDVQTVEETLSERSLNMITFFLLLFKLLHQLKLTPRLIHM